MNLLYISNEYPPETGLGGIGTYTRHIARAMSGRGHTVHIICRSPHEKQFDAMDGDCIVHRIPPAKFKLPESKALYLIRVCLRTLFFQSLVKDAWSRAAAGAVQSLVQQGIKVDIIESAECNGESYHLRNYSGIQRVVKLHTPWSMVRSLDHIREGFFDRIASDRMERIAACTAAAVSSPTQSLAKLIEIKWSLPSIPVVPNPIPASEYPETQGGGIIFTGRVERRKGVDILLRAYAEVCAHCNPPLLRIIGRPYGQLPGGTLYGDYIERLIRELNLSKRIDWVRGVPPEAVAQYLQKSSIAVFPSLWENLPYSCLEAMASGLAIAASRVGGYTEMIEDGVSGILFAPEQHLDLAEKLRQLIAKPDLAKTLGIQARRRIAERYDTAPASQATEDFYQHVQSNPKS